MGVKKPDENSLYPEPLSQKEKKLIEILRGLDYGELVVVVKGGTPVHIEEIKKSIKL